MEEQKEGARQMNRGREKNGGKREGEDWKKKMDGMMEGRGQDNIGGETGAEEDGGRWRKMQVEGRGKTKSSL